MNIPPQVEQALRAYAAKSGFSPTEIQTMSKDMRLVQLALKAMAWDGMHAK